MCATYIISFVLSAFEGIAGGVIENLKVNDKNIASNGENEDEEQSALLLMTKERNAFNDFYIYDPDDVIYEEFSPPDESDDVKDKGEDKIRNTDLSLRWRKYRPSLCSWLGYCFKQTFCILVLSGICFALVSVLIMFIDINTVDVCAAVKWENVPKNVQRVHVTVETFEGWLIQVLHILTMLFFFGWDLIGPMHLLGINIAAAFLDSVYRLYLQVYDVYNISWISFPLNALCMSVLLFNSYKLAFHFYPRQKGKRAFLTFQLGAQFFLGNIVVYTTVYTIIPWFISLTPMNQAIVAACAPITGAICKAIVRILVQNMSSINHPGKSYILVYVAYITAPMVYRTLQAEIESFQYFAMLCVAHALVGLLERLSVALRDHFYVWFYRKILKRERFDSEIGCFRTPRTQRLLTDLTLINIIHEVSSLILTNAFVQLYAFQFGKNDRGESFASEEILYEFFLRTVLAITVEYVFGVFGVFIMTWYMNLPVLRVWRKKWKSMIFTNLIVTGILVMYTTHHLVKVVDGKYDFQFQVNHTRTCVPSNLLFFK